MKIERDGGALRPELIFALAGPLGTRLGDLSVRLKDELANFGYEIEHIRVSELLSRFEDWSELPGKTADIRVRHLQSVANSVRRRLGDGAVLARAAIAELRQLRKERTGDADKGAPNCAFIIDQLKNPAEAQLLRDTYGDAFYLIGGHASRGKREERLAQDIATSVAQSNQWEFRRKASELIDTDDRSDDAFGQNMRDTYPQSDVFINMNPDGGESEVGRFIELLFGHPFHTPVPDEYAMYMATAASLRSSDSNRQVGAVIVNVEPNEQHKYRDADILAVGMNEVPQPGGGYYWTGASPDARDQIQEDRAKEIKVSILAEMAGRLRANGVSIGAGEDWDVARRWLDVLAGTQFVDIGEFSRPVHAEMAAIIDAARRGVSIDGMSIYVTTFPCHNCAKHIVAAGLERVIYLEPYPKSRAETLYREALACDSEDGHARPGKVVFCAYSGVAPRQYDRLFPMRLRGGKRGLPLTEWKKQRPMLKPRNVPAHLQVGYVAAEREALKALEGAGYSWDPAAVCPL